MCIHKQKRNEINTGLQNSTTAPRGQQSSIPSHSVRRPRSRLGFVVPEMLSGLILHAMRGLRQEIGRGREQKEDLERVSGLTPRAQTSLRRSAASTINHT